MGSFWNAFYSMSPHESRGGNRPSRKRTVANVVSGSEQSRLDADRLGTAQERTPRKESVAEKRSLVGGLEARFETHLQRYGFLFSVAFPSHGLDALDHEPPGEGARDHGERCKNEGSVE